MPGKRRKHGPGELFGNLHRDRLEPLDLAADVDGVLVMHPGSMDVVTANTEGRLYVEFVLDQRKLQNYRDMGVVATFARMAHEGLMEQKDHKSLWPAIDMAFTRGFGCIQNGIYPSMWAVVGPEHGPLRMYRMDLVTAKAVEGPYVVTDMAEWNELWERLGIRETRRQLSQYLAQGGTITLPGGQT